MVRAMRELQRSYGTFPASHQYSTLDDLEATPDNPGLEIFFEAAKKLTKQWTGDQFAGLHLYGTPGTGKTHAAIGLARVLHEQGANIHYRHVPSWKPQHVQRGLLGSIEAVPTHIQDWTDTRDLSRPRTYKNTPPFATIEYAKDGTKKPVRFDEKNVLILDDFQPRASDYTRTALEAAHEHGGLVVITSNATDPLSIVDPPPENESAYALLEMLGRNLPDFAEAKKEIDERNNQKLHALRSRVGAAFKFIHFEGRDRRAENSFWSDPPKDQGARKHPFKKQD